MEHVVGEKMGVQLEMECARQPIPSGPQPGNAVKDVVLLVNLELGTEISEIRGAQAGFSQSCILPNMSEINFHCTTTLILSHSALYL